jgi:hypothetical protein
MSQEDQRSEIIFILTKAVRRLGEQSGGLEKSSQSSENSLDVSSKMRTHVSVVNEQ